MGIVDMEQRPTALQPDDPGTKPMSAPVSFRTYDYMQQAYDSTLQHILSMQNSWTLLLTMLLVPSPFLIHSMILPLQNQLSSWMLVNLPLQNQLLCKISSQYEETRLYVESSFLTNAHNWLMHVSVFLLATEKVSISVLLIQNYEQPLFLLFDINHATFTQSYEKLFFCSLQ